MVYFFDKKFSSEPLVLEKCHDSPGQGQTGSASHSHHVTRCLFILEIHVPSVHESLVSQLTHLSTFELYVREKFLDVLFATSICIVLVTDGLLTVFVEVFSTDYLNIVGAGLAFALKSADIRGAIIYLVGVVVKVILGP